jgi:uncharacterized membrane protein YjgN (DUF898 family)
MSSFAEPAESRVRFLGRRRIYWRLLARGAVLLLLTLGLYRFWLMTDVRRFLWSHSEIAGETLEYSGSALELLLGFLVAVAVLLPLYAAFFLAALQIGAFAEWSGLLAFLGLGFLGQYAIYRARRYRLSRTIYRGLRFAQNGSAWSHAVRAFAWWALTGLTLGLAYPFQLASLERYKMRHTSYGDLQGRFIGAGWRLFLRGMLMWIAVVGPLLLALGALTAAIDWSAVAGTVEQGGDDVMARIEGGNPGFGGAIAFALLMITVALAMAALLYPVFQAVVLRWWCSGLSFGELRLDSKLRIRDVYGAYMRFLWYALLFSIALALAALPALLALGLLEEKLPDSIAADAASIGLALAGYVVAMLGYSTIYRATVGFSLWQLGMESIVLTGAPLLDQVEARGRASSPLSEGLADALNVGGL